MYLVDYQISDSEWVTLKISYGQSDLLDALMDIWIERDRQLREPNVFRASQTMTELYRQEQQLLSVFL